MISSELRVQHLPEISRETLFDDLVIGQRFKYELSKGNSLLSLHEKK